MKKYMRYDTSETEMNLQPLLYLSLPLFVLLPLSALTLFSSIKA
jgi:hypothetical protein